MHVGQNRHLTQTPFSQNGEFNAARTAMLLLQWHVSHMWPGPTAIWLPSGNFLSFTVRPLDGAIFFIDIFAHFCTFLGNDET